MSSVTKIREIHVHNINQRFAHRRIDSHTETTRQRTKHIVRMTAGRLFSLSL